MNSWRQPAFDPSALYKALFLTAVALFVATPLVATVLGRQFSRASLAA